MLRKIYVESVREKNNAGCLFHYYSNLRIPLILHGGNTHKIKKVTFGPNLLFRNLTRRYRALNTKRLLSLPEIL